MKRLLIVLVLLPGAVGTWAAAGFSPANAQSATAAEAESQTAVFAIENLTCALCPLTVRTAIAGVEGVTSVRVDFKSKTATVVFDPAMTNTEAIGAASTNAGYPASVRD